MIPISAGGPAGFSTFANTLLTLCLVLQIFNNIHFKLFIFLQIFITLCLVLWIFKNIYFTLCLVLWIFKNIHFTLWHIVPPPLNVFGLGGVRVPIFFENDLPRNDLPYTKGFMKFWCPEPSKKMFDFWNFCSSMRLYAYLHRYMQICDQIGLGWRQIYSKCREKSFHFKEIRIQTHDQHIHKCNQGTAV